jgi:hypothetical protein
MRFYTFCLSGDVYHNWPTVVVVADGPESARRKAEAYVLNHLADDSDFADYMRRVASVKPWEQDPDGACV